MLDPQGKRLETADNAYEGFTRDLDPSPRKRFRCDSYANEFVANSVGWRPPAVGIELNVYL